MDDSIQDLIDGVDADSFKDLNPMSSGQIFNYNEMLQLQTDRMVHRHDDANFSQLSFNFLTLSPFSDEIFAYGERTQRMQEPENQAMKIEDGMKQQKNQRKQMDFLERNETKNITRNFGRAIITYVQKYQKNICPLLKEHGTSYDELMVELKRVRQNLNTIMDLRELWMEFKYSRCMRILSNSFLKKHCLSYIFNSKVSNQKSHIKYRKRLQRALEQPQSFSSMKGH